MKRETSKHPKPKAAAGMYKEKPKMPPKPPAPPKGAHGRKK